MTGRPTLLASALALTLLVAATGPADAATRKSCLRGGAKLEQRSGSVRIVRLAAKPRSGQTRRELVLACWAPTGKRVTIAEEVDNGLDNIASSRSEIVGGRYAGVVETNEGGVSISVTARVYDVRTRRLLHDSDACGDNGDFSGPDDVAFLDRGGLALACRKLVVYRRGGSAAQLLEPDGTDVRQVAVSRHANGFGQRLFWTVGDDVTKSAAL